MLPIRIRQPCVYVPGCDGATADVAPCYDRAPLLYGPVITLPPFPPPRPDEPETPGDRAGSLPHSFEPGTELTLRDRLVRAMGLAFDPFRVGFAEREEQDRYFGKIYVDPPARSSLPDTGEVPLRARLERDTHTFVFADYGQGKSATRLALEYRLRSATHGVTTLAVRYTPNVRSTTQDDQPKTAEEHLVAIAGELLIDLLVQSLERLQLRAHAIETLSPERRELLVRLCRSSPGTLRRSIRIWATSEQPDSLPWGSLRAPVLVREAARRWQTWLQGLYEEARQRPAESWTWQALAAAARTLGFDRIFLLIDAIDEDTIDLQHHIAIVRPFVEQLAAFRAEQVFVKAFLPIGLEPAFNTGSEFAPGGLTGLYELATIPKASPEHLNAIIHQRLATAAQSDSSFQSLDWFCGPDLADVSIQDRLVELANGSPRGLIILVSKLLDFYSTAGFQHDQTRLTLTATEWRHFLDLGVDRMAPLPPARQLR